MFPLFMIHVNLSQSHTQAPPPTRFVKSGFQVFSLITLSLILQREIFYIVLNIFKLLINNESTYNKILIGASCSIINDIQEKSRFSYFEKKT